MVGVRAACSQALSLRLSNVCMAKAVQHRGSSRTSLAHRATLESQLKSAWFCVEVSLAGAQNLHQRRSVLHIETYRASTERHP